MAKKYFAWKNPDCNGKDIEWMELTGKEFYNLTKQYGSKNRRFICMDNDICPDADVIYIEATEVQYKDWYTEFCHHKYLSKFRTGRAELSLDTWFDEGETNSFYDLIADSGAEFEEDVLRHNCEEVLPDALASLTPLRREAVELKYLIHPSKSDLEIAAMLGIGRQTFTDRKRYGLEDLKIFWNPIRQNPKSVANSKCKELTSLRVL